MRVLNVHKRSLLTAGKTATWSGGENCWRQSIKQRAEHKTLNMGEAEELPLLAGSNPVLTTKN